MVVVIRVDLVVVGRCGGSVVEAHGSHRESASVRGPTGGFHGPGKGLFTTASGKGHTMFAPPNSFSVRFERVLFH